MERPTEAEYAPFYAGYIHRVPDGDVIEQLRAQGRRTAAALSALDPAVGGRAYAPGRWTVNELVAHLADADRVFAFRALSFARRDPAPQPGMDQDLWNEASGARDRTLRSLVDELAATRAACVELFAGLRPDTQRRTGEASGCLFTVRTLPWIMAGHELHHLEVLRERYGIDVPVG